MVQCRVVVDESQTWIAITEKGSQFYDASDLLSYLIGENAGSLETVRLGQNQKYAQSVYY